MIRSTPKPKTFADTTMTLLNKTTFFTILLFALGGCSNKIHLFTAGYPPADVDKLRQALEQQGFDVEQAGIIVPPEYPNGVISMPPNFPSPALIADIQQVLAAQGYHAAQEFKFGQGNHHYLADIGLYLRHPDVDPALAMPPYLEGNGCQKESVSLTLQESGRFLVESEQRVGDNYRLARHQGQWQFDGRQLRLAPNGADALIFEKYWGVEDTPVGQRQAEYYRPTGISKLPELNCTFSIVHMDSGGFRQ